jgi:hypothetical protein
MEDSILKPIDYYVYVCLKNTICNTAKDISKYLKIDYPHIYDSSNRLVQTKRIYKTNDRPAEYIIIGENMEKLNNQLQNIKDDPALMLGLFRTMMDKSKFLRKILIKNIVEKESVKDAMKEWLKASIDEKNKWINTFYLGEGANIDTFINACIMLKNTKDERIVLQYIIDNSK